MPGGPYGICRLGRGSTGKKLEFVSSAGGGGAFSEVKFALLKTDPLLPQDT